MLNVFPGGQILRLSFCFKLDSSKVKEGMCKTVHPKEKEYPFPAKKYMLTAGNRNTRKRCEIYSKLTIESPERFW